MACFSWLHLTDLHCGQQEHSWLLPGVQDIFFEDIEKLYQKCGPWDLVLFTGDLTQKGTTEDFQTARVFLDRLWKCFETFDAPLPTLLAVPGNHDLVRPAKKTAAVRMLTENFSDIQEEFWDDTAEEGEEYRQIVTTAFENYMIWWNAQPFRTNTITSGLLPGDFSVSIEKEDAQLGIVGLNTSFLQLTGDDYNGKLALHPLQFHRACDGDGIAWVKKHHACLLLTHHPPAWLSKTSRKDLYAEIAAHGRFAWHLCGHNHEIAVYEVSDSGTEPRRLWVGKSLFGLEYFGHEQKRLHGYAAGRLELHGKTGSITFWPRETRLQGGQRNIVPDLSQNLTDDQHTIPREFDLLRSYAVKSEPQESAEQSGNHTIQIGHAEQVRMYQGAQGKDKATLTGQIEQQALDAYLRRVFRTTLELDLGGIDPKVAAGKQRDACLNLPEVYTALLTMSTAEHEAHIAEKRDIPERERLRSAVDMLNAEKRLVLLGDPGSGKSMFVNFVTLCMAGELLHEQDANCNLLVQALPNEEGELEEQPQPWEWNGLLPVKFVLRDVAAKALPEQPDAPGKVTHLLDYLEKLLADCDLSRVLSAIKAHLDSQGGIVLFDGLDEVPEADKRRLQILQAVEDFASRFDKCRILVTCRTYAYQKQEWRLKNFHVAVLSPFTDGQIRWFVNGWYRHVAEKRDTNRENWQGRAELLKQAIFRSPQLHSFARRPLLLTLMASLHAWRGGSLPEKRAELYEDATDMLLETWVEKKAVRAADGTRLLLPSLEDVLNVSKNDLKPVLQQLAFEAHQRQPLAETGTADIPEHDLIDRLLDLCRQKHINPLDLTDHLSNRVGLLASHGNRVYTFPHRSFQEYLAACHLAVDENYPYNIAELVRESPDRWREIALLTAAATSKYSVMFDGFVNALCPEPVPQILNSAADVEAYAVILAAQAVVEAEKVNELAARKQKQVTWLRDWLKAILTEEQPQQPLPALERARAGDLLAVFGDDRPGMGLQEDGLPDIVWCEVPEGKFTMGSDPKKDTEAYDDEQPQHEVHVSAFQISRYPVTNAQYQAFVEDGGYTKKWHKCWTQDGWKWKEEEQLDTPEKYGGLFDLSNHPVVLVSWYEASAFCQWLTLRLREKGELADNQIIRLPSEAEWEKAARGEDGRIYSWGKSITPELANYSDTGLGATSTVGCFPRGVSPYKCEDMAGNVWEWCQDWFQSAYYAESPERDPQGPDSGEVFGGEPFRVLRGGSWDATARGVQCACRYRDWPSRRGYGIGFRPVRIYS